MAHIEMLATAIALKLEGAPKSTVDRVVGENPIVESIMGGMNPRHFLSGGLGALPTDSSGVPFNGSWVVSTGNIAS